MYGLLVEYIVGCAVGLEFFWKEEDDDFGYIVIELFFLRIVISY